MKRVVIFTMFIIGSTSALAGHMQREIVCLAENIYHEARGEAQSGQKAVAMVTMNRVYSGMYPGTVCEVVYQPYQFSWTIGKKRKILESVKWQQSLKLAWEVYTNYDRLKDNTRGAMFYYAHKVVYPKWADSMIRTRKIGNHTFMILPPTAK